MELSSAKGDALAGELYKRKQLLYATVGDPGTVKVGKELVDLPINNV